MENSTTFYFFADDSEELEDPEFQRPKKKASKQLNRKRLHKESKRAAVAQFIDDKASEGSDDEDGGIGKREDAYYDPSQLARKNVPIQLDEMAERYAAAGDQEDDDNDAFDEDMHLPEGYTDEDLVNRSLLPSPNKDPKLWQVRVKKNFEKMAVMALLNKSIDFA